MQGWHCQMSALLIRFTRAHGCPVYLSPDGQVLQANPHPDAQIVRNTPAVFVLNSPEAATSPRCPTSCLAPLQKKPIFPWLTCWTNWEAYPFPWVRSSIRPFPGYDVWQGVLEKSFVSHSAWGVIELRTFTLTPGITITEFSSIFRAILAIDVQRFRATLPVGYLRFRWHDGPRWSQSRHRVHRRAFDHLTMFHLRRATGESCGHGPTCGAGRISGLQFHFWPWL